jgi:hypothetical protein
MTNAVDVAGPDLQAGNGLLPAGDGPPADHLPAAAVQVLPANNVIRRGSSPAGAAARDMVAVAVPAATAPVPAVAVRVPAVAVREAAGLVAVVPVPVEAVVQGGVKTANDSPLQQTNRV